MDGLWRWCSLPCCSVGDIHACAGCPVCCWVSSGPPGVVRPVWMRACRARWRVRTFLSSAASPSCRRHAAMRPRSFCAWKVQRWMANPSHCTGTSTCPGSTARRRSSRVRAGICCYGSSARAVCSIPAAPIANARRWSAAWWPPAMCGTLRRTRRWATRRSASTACAMRFREASPNASAIRTTRPSYRRFRSATRAGWRSATGTSRVPTACRISSPFPVFTSAWPRYLACGWRCWRMRSGRAWDAGCRGRRRRPARRCWWQAFTARWRVLVCPRCARC
jgi:hypothetical protein